MYICILDSHDYTFLNIYTNIYHNFTETRTRTPKAENEKVISYSMNTFYLTYTMNDHDVLSQVTLVAFIMSQSVIATANRLKGNSRNFKI